MKTNLWILQRHTGPLNYQDVWAKTYREARGSRNPIVTEKLIESFRSMLEQSQWVTIMNARPLDVAMKWAVKERARFTVRLKHTETDEIIMGDIL